MEFYPSIITLHIIFAGMWLSSFVSHPFLKSTIIRNKNKNGEKKFIHLYLTFSSRLGMITSLGILITGIIMVSMNPGYGFFQMSANHWLATKQIIMVAILVILGAYIIPTSKKLRTVIGQDLDNNAPISEEGYKSLYKLFKLGTTIGILVLINFLLAITHIYFG